MTAKELFDLALGCLPAAPGDEAAFAPRAPAWLNVLLAEALAYENMLREYACEEGHNDAGSRKNAEGILAVSTAEQLDTAPQIEALSDEVPYAAAICVPALVWGLAARMFAEDENEAKAQEMRNRYVVALHEAVKVAEGKVMDVY